jgi:hypothetical protein
VSWSAIGVEGDGAAGVPDNAAVVMAGSLDRGGRAFPSGRWM